MAITELKFGGLGGQGVILAGMIVGRAACIHDKRHATLTQSFGPEARGSACSASVIISDKPVLHPYVLRPDILTVMSQEACRRFAPAMAPQGLLLYESELVTPETGGVPDSARCLGIPATRMAEELGRRMVGNIVMVGFFAATTGLLDAAAVRESVLASVPAGTTELNLKAFEQGFAYGRNLTEQCAPA